MKRFLRYAIGAALLLALFWWVARGGSEPDIADGSLLVIELSRPLRGRPGAAAGAPARRARCSRCSALTSELRKAARDERLAGVVFRVRGLDARLGAGRGDPRGDPAARREGQAHAGRARGRGLRQRALLRGERGRARGGDARRQLRPSSASPRSTCSSGGLFEKLGVDVEYERVGEYKSAVESYAESKMSDANREQTNALRRLDRVAVHRGRSRPRGSAARSRCASRSTPRRARPKSSWSTAWSTRSRAFDAALDGARRARAGRGRRLCAGLARERRLRARRHLRDRARRGRGRGGRGQPVGRQPGDGLRHAWPRRSTTPPRTRA